MEERLDISSRKLILQSSRMKREAELAVVGSRRCGVQDLEVERSEVFKRICVCDASVCLEDSS